MSLQEDNFGEITHLTFMSTVQDLISRKNHYFFKLLYRIEEKARLESEKEFIAMNMLQVWAFFS